MSTAIWPASVPMPAVTETIALSAAPEPKQPKPTGYRIILLIPRKSEKVGSVYLPDQSRKTEEVASILGQVVALGPDAYKDASRFPTGPWCAVGDFVMFRAYSGTRFIRGDNEYRIINDDTVEAVVSDPSEVQRP